MLSATSYLNYAVICTINQDQKIQIVQGDRGRTLPRAGHFLLSFGDSWYTTAKVMDRFIRKGFYAGWGVKNDQIAIMQDPSSQCICPSFAENRPDVQPRDRWRREFYMPLPD